MTSVFLPTGTKRWFPKSAQTPKSLSRHASFVKLSQKLSVRFAPNLAGLWIIVWHEKLWSRFPKKASYDFLDIFEFSNFWNLSHRCPCGQKPILQPFLTELSSKVAYMPTKKGWRRLLLVWHQKFGMKSAKVTRSLRSATQRRLPSSRTFDRGLG